MPLTEGQVQLRDVVMGPGTPYRLATHFNPFTLTVRADQGGPRPWEHGSWSGVEWREEIAVPIRITTLGSGAAGWLALHQPLAAAFAPSFVDLPLPFVVGGQEFVMFGRPRVVEPEPRHVDGHGKYSLAFVALDPTIYAGVESVTDPIPLPSQAGGAALPVTLPLTVGGSLVGGTAQLVNAGTKPTGLLARIDGPAAQPRIVLRGPDGLLQSIRVDIDLAAGLWLDVNTAAGTVLLNGLEESNQRGRAAWDIDPAPLLPGTTELRFSAADFTAATLVARHRSAWW